MIKKYLTIIYLLAATFAAKAQQLHFAYLQTDTHKPFYVILNKKTYSSTASGYIILPRLQNGDYAIRVGFAKNEEAEQDYQLQIKENDQGLLIKDFGNKGWGLFNMQTMAVQYAGTAAQERAKLAAAEKAEADERQRKLQEEANAAETQRRNDSLKTIASQQQHTDPLNTALAEAETIRKRNTDDSIAALKNNAALQKSYTDSVNNEKATAAENERLEKIADAAARARDAAAEKQRLNNIAKNEKKTTEVIKPDSVPPHIADAALQPPVLLQQKFTDSGWQFTYRITNQSQRETVNVFIPAAQPKLPVVSVVPATEKDSVIQPLTQAIDSTKTSNTTIVTDTNTVSKNVFVDTPKTTAPIIAGNISTNQNIKPDTIVVQQAEKSILNPNCKALADEKDFFNIRRKIASAIGTEQMLIAARKMLKGKCYTTEQLRNLAVLFLTDAGRYQFMDAAYPFAFDAFRYNTLQDLLIDDYYVQRFKAMLH